MAAQRRKPTPKLYKHRATKRLYTFFSQARAEQVELACTGIEIGVELAYTNEAIKVRYKPAAFDPSALEELWENRAHGLLLELSTATLAHPGMRETPALLFEGVGLWEAGRHDEGMARIQEYQRQHARSWTMNYAAIGMHYQGLEHLAPWQARRWAGTPEGRVRATTRSPARQTKSGD